MWRWRGQDLPHLLWAVWRSTQPGFEATQSTCQLQTALDAFSVLHTLLCFVHTWYRRNLKDVWISNCSLHFYTKWGEGVFQCLSFCDIINVCARIAPILKSFFLQYFKMIVFAIFQTRHSDKILDSTLLTQPVPVYYVVKQLSTRAVLNPGFCHCVWFEILQKLSSWNIAKTPLPGEDEEESCVPWFTPRRCQIKI